MARALQGYVDLTGDIWRADQLWDGSDKIVNDIIADVNREEGEKKKRKRGAPAKEVPGSAHAEANRSALVAEPEDTRPRTIDVTFGKEGSLGIAFSDEGWEIEVQHTARCVMSPLYTRHLTRLLFAQDIVEDGAAAEMEVLRPGLYLTQVQSVSILDKDGTPLQFACGYPLHDQQCGAPSTVPKSCSSTLPLVALTAAVPWPGCAY